MLVANRAKNPNIATPIVAQAIIVNRYEVSYYRSDGRAQQGVDVPYSISGAITPAVDAANTVPTAASPSRWSGSQAKLEAPLLQLAGSGGGQALIVTMFAKITLYGQTVAGAGNSRSGEHADRLGELREADGKCGATRERGVMKNQASAGGFRAARRPSAS